MEHTQSANSSVFSLKYQLGAVSLISYSVVLSLMPQHDNSIRSALCTNNDPSMIGRAARIPFQYGLVVSLHWRKNTERVRNGYAKQYPFWRLTRQTTHKSPGNSLRLTMQTTGVAIQKNEKDDNPCKSHQTSNRASGPLN